MKGYRVKKLDILPLSFLAIVDPNNFPKLPNNIKFVNHDKYRYLPRDKIIVTTISRHNEMSYRPKKMIDVSDCNRETEITFRRHKTEKQDRFSLRTGYNVVTFPYIWRHKPRKRTLLTTGLNPTCPNFYLRKKDYNSLCFRQKEGHLMIIREKGH